MGSFQPQRKGKRSHRCGFSLECCNTREKELQTALHLSPLSWWRLHPDGRGWRPAAPGLILSPLPGAGPSLASAKGHRYTVLCPWPAPAYLIGGQEWPCRVCQGPPSAGPRHQTQGPMLAPLLFEALGRLIGLLCRAPLWGSAQACSSCWVSRRRKEQRLIPLQVSLSVAAALSQWLTKVTAATG